MKHGTLGRGLVLTAMAAALAGMPMASVDAVTGSVDMTPAATLLLPYFEVDLDDPNGSQTRFSVINTGAAPALAHVTMWSNVGVPTFTFDVYLEGRDTVEIDLRLVFQGVLPQTGPGQVTLGSLSDPTTTFPACSSGIDEALGVSLPIPDLLSDSQVAHLAAAHTGQKSASFGNLCAGVDFGDNVARGYVTIDAVSECSVETPASPGYFFVGGTGVANNDNVLSGSFSLITRGAASRAGTSALVHIEADGASAATTTPGSYTFYSSYNAATAVDNREPVGTVWQARYFTDALFDAGSEAIVWRDPGGRLPTPYSGTPCDVPSAVFPLDQFAVMTFDEEEQAQILNADSVFPNPQPAPTLPFPLAAQRVDFTEFTPFASGWAVLNLNTTGAPGGAGSGLRQSVVLTRHSRNGQATSFLPATFSAGPAAQSGGPTTCAGADVCNSFTPGAF